MILVQDRCSDSEEKPLFPALVTNKPPEAAVFSGLPLSTAFQKNRGLGDKWVCTAGTSRARPRSIGHHSWALHVPSNSPSLPKTFPFFRNI